MAELHQIFACCLWTWLGPLMALWYVMYFWFCGWRHVFTRWPYGTSSVCLCSKSAIVKTTALISTAFCSMVKVSKYMSWVVHWGQSLLCTIALLLLCRGIEALDDEEGFYYTEVEPASSSSSLSSSPVHDPSSAADLGTETMFSSPIAMDHNYHCKVRLPGSRSAGKHTNSLNV